MLRVDDTLVISRIGDIRCPPRGTPDPEILLWCERESAVLVTNNRESMPNHLAAHLADGRHIRGIFSIGRLSIGEVIDELLAFLDGGDPDDYWDVITFLPL